MTTCKYRPEDYPNLWRVAREIARCKNPDRVLNELVAVAGNVLREGIDHE